MSRVNHTAQSKSCSRRVVISGIGTGGHYLPALVVAQELMRRNIEVVVLVRRGYLEEEIAHTSGVRTYAITTSAYYGRPLYDKVASVLSLLYSIVLIHALTKKVIGIAFGGFGALPLLMSCIVNRSPFCLFEPNRIPGRATRLFASRAQKIFLGLGCETELKGATVITGIPIREEFKKARVKHVERATKKILFMGGSQGAHRLNMLALEITKLLPEAYHIVVISGKRDYDNIKSQCDRRTTVIPFTRSPWIEMQDADVIVSRAGALAGYEIVALGKPALFIPFPFAIDDHQYYNARYFSSCGNATVIREAELTPELLVQNIKQLMATGIKESQAIISDAEKRIASIVEKQCETS